MSQLPKVTTKSHEVLHESPLFKFCRDSLELSPEDQRHDYYMLITPPFAVMVLATTPEGLYIINKEYRHPTQEILLSCPGGIHEKEESYLECAARELKEETGYSAQNFRIIGTCYPFPGAVNQKTIYVRSDQALLSSECALEEMELITTQVWSREALLRAIHEGAALDGHLATALFFDSMDTRKPSLLGGG